MEEITIRVDCDGCGASYILKHEMDDERYNINHCTFCGSNNIEKDEITPHDKD